MSSKSLEKKSRNWSDFHNRGLRKETHTVRVNLILPHSRHPGAGLPCASISIESVNRCNRAKPPLTAAATFVDFFFFSFKCQSSISFTTSAGPVDIWTSSWSFFGKDFLYFSKASFHASITGVSHEFGTGVTVAFGADDDDEERAVILIVGWL